MDDDVYAFLEKWVEENVAPVDAGFKSERLDDLVGRCLRDAEEAGFIESDVEEAAAELGDCDDLTAYLEAALEKVGEEELAELDA